MKMRITPSIEILLNMCKIISAEKFHDFSVLKENSLSSILPA